MAFMNRASLHLALYESSYAAAPKVVETTMSEVPNVGYKIPIGHVKRVMKNPFRAPLIWRKCGGKVEG